MFSYLSEFQSLVVSKKAAIREVMQRLTDEKSRTAFVVDGLGVLAGSVSDGDIRRGLLAGFDLDTQISQVMFLDPFVVEGDKYDSKDLSLICEEKHIELIPTVDSVRTLTGILQYTASRTAMITESPVIIMVGGEGSRLGSLTQTTPKPLLKVRDKPIIQIILERLSHFGFSKIYLCINYKGKMIQDFCGSGERFDLSIEYVQEEKKLGTIGAARLLEDKLKTPFLVMNGDLLTSLNYRHLLDFHMKQKAEMTVATRGFPVAIPYGVLEIEGTEIARVLEKPVYNYSINAGIYALNPSVLPIIPKNEFYDITSLMRDLRKQEKRVAAFPVPEYWLDIGNLSDYEKANEDYSLHFEN